MGRLAEWWQAGGRERWSLAWPTRPRTVWSYYGGRRRQVTVVWRRDERMLLGYCAFAFVLGLAYITGLALLAVGIVALLGWWVLGDAPGPPFDGGVFPASGLVVSVVMGVLTLIGLHVWSAVSARRDRRKRREPFEGAVVFRAIVDMYDSEGDAIGVPYLAVDDATTDTVTAFLVQPEFHDHVMVGDVVRVLPEDDNGARPVEPLHDAHRRPLPPVGTMPGAAPVQTPRRSIKEATAAANANRALRERKVARPTGFPFSFFTIVDWGYDMATVERYIRGVWEHHEQGLQSRRHPPPELVEQGYDPHQVDRYLADIRAEPFTDPAR